MEVQRLFMAFDVTISDEMKAHPDGKIKNVILAIDHIKTKTREEIQNLPAQVAKNNVDIKLQQQIDHIKPVTIKQTLSAERAKDDVDSKLTQPKLKPISHKKSEVLMGHIFISYSHQTTERAMQLRDILRSCGLPVWIDAEAIRGNSIESMVLGLNDARLVIMCLSDGYRQSDFCKREAEYTVIKKLPIQPVILQEGFHMENDWLRFVVGLQNWIDLSGEMQFNANKAQFVEHVQHLIGNGSSKAAAAAALPEETITRSQAHALHASNPSHGGATSVDLSSSTAKKLDQWKAEEVLKWLDQEHLSDAKDK